jgi:hypothetical protein
LAKNDDPWCLGILANFATAIEQLAYHVDPTLPKDHIRREGGNVFTDRVEHPTTKIQLLQEERRQ